MKLTSLQFKLQRKLGENAKLQNTQIDLQETSNENYKLTNRACFQL
jgi:hypothetical protein